MQRVFHGIRFKVNKGCLSAMDGQFFYISPCKIIHPKHIRHLCPISARYRDRMCAIFGQDRADPTMGRKTNGEDADMNPYHLCCHSSDNQHFFKTTHTKLRRDCKCRILCPQNILSPTLSKPSDTYNLSASGFS